MNKVFSTLILLSISFSSFGVDGLWFPQLLDQLNESEMKQLGMKISADDIYSLNHSSLKDAVVQFGGGCTGEIISNRGLLITNHHCGFSQIQSLSSIEKNYLENGYWAMSDSAELPCPGLTVTFVREIVDVSSIVLRNVNDSLTEDERNLFIKVQSDSLEKNYSNGKNHKAFVRSFYNGNQYYLFTVDIFRDIRFVGAPPASVGNFGGETDNWEWPRHTGDFSLFRIYADSSNGPADYSVDNIPFTPKRFFEINISPVKENDFTFIYGFPGRTNEYITSSALDLIYSQTNPNKVLLREKRLAIWRKDMLENKLVNLQYAGKFKTLANYAKKWKGEIVGIKDFNVIQLKRNYEEKIVGLSGQRLKPILDSIESINSKLKPLSNNTDYFTDGLAGIELGGLSAKFEKLISLSQSDTTSYQTLDTELKRLKADYRGFHKNYSKATDRKICTTILGIASDKIDEQYKPEFLKSIHTEWDVEKYTEKLFSNSLLSDTTALLKFLNNYKRKQFKKIVKDPVYLFGKQISSSLKYLGTLTSPLSTQLTVLQRKYMDLIMTYDTQRKFYPDANSTLRVSYGNVKGMFPADGLIYNYFTTTDGVLQKIDNSNPDFDYPPELEKLIREKDFGEYAVNGTVPVCFLASNHTTNGNSGSPVINANGQLIGINFDRPWEGNMSDYFFNDSTCRNIAMDMHFFLFVVDKFGKDKRLLNEMKIVR